MARTAACNCGALALVVEGEPVRVSVCHCLACQQRTGSVFAAQARFPRAAVTITGPYREWSRVSDDGDGRTQAFCETCGSTVFFRLGPDFVGVPVGAFADPSFPPPTVSVWEERRHPWVVLPDGIEHLQ